MAIIEKGTHLVPTGSAGFLTAGKTYVVDQVIAKDSSQAICVFQSDVTPEHILPLQYLPKYFVGVTSSLLDALKYLRAYGHAYSYSGICNNVWCNKRQHYTMAKYGRLGQNTQALTTIQCHHHLAPRPLTMRKTYGVLTSTAMLVADSLTT